MNGTGRTMGVRALGSMVTGAMIASLLAVMAPPAAAAPRNEVTVSITDPSVAEGNSGTTQAVFNVSLATPASATTSMMFATANGSATAGSDYTASSGTLTFAAGQSTRQIAVNVTGDSIFETNETFSMTLSPAGGKNAVKLAGDKSATATITNDDEAPAFSIGDVTVTEGNSGTTTASFPVTLTSSTATDLTVAYETIAGTAEAGTDFVSKNGTLTFAPGDLSEPVAVSVKGDVFDENDEAFSVSLSLPTGAVIADGSGAGTITDDDAAPKVSIADTVASEPASGDQNDAIFTVSLSAPSQKTVSVAYATSDATALAGEDYVAESGTVTFDPGVTQQQVAVALLHDATSTVSGDAFDVTLSSPTDADLGRAVATGTILDHDPRPVITAGSVQIQEGDEGQATASVTVGLSIASADEITVDWATANGTAQAGSDFEGQAATQLVFAAGERSKTVQVPVTGDVVDEEDEDFGIVLSNPSTAGEPSLGGNGTVTVADDDAPPKVSVGDVTISEVDKGSAKATFTLTLSGPSDRAITVTYALENGTALNGSDFTGGTGTLTFQPGELSKTLDVTVHGDDVDEPDETFYVQLTNFQNAEGEKDRGTGTIKDTDKSRSTTAFKVRKRATRMIVKGTQRKPRPGQRMVVKLMKRKAGKWALVTTKRPMLSAAKDVNGDGVKESTFRVRLRRPATAKLFKIVAKYRGDSDNLASSATRRVRYRS